jgi:hypothetical protein
MAFGRSVLAVRPSVTRTPAPRSSASSTCEQPAAFLCLPLSGLCLPFLLFLSFYPRFLSLWALAVSVLRDGASLCLCRVAAPPCCFQSCLSADSAPCWPVCSLPCLLAISLLSDRPGRASVCFRVLCFPPNPTFLLQKQPRLAPLNPLPTILPVVGNQRVALPKRDTIKDLAPGCQRAQIRNGGSRLKMLFALSRPVPRSQPSSSC